MLRRRYPRTVNRRYGKRRRFVRRTRRLLPARPFRRPRRLLFRRRRGIDFSAKSAFSKPVSAVLRLKQEDTVSKDSESWCHNFNMNFFNNLVPRKQVKGYLDVFDQFKVHSYTTILRMKDWDWYLTNENTAIPVLYTAYDVDAQGRTVDIDNMLCLQNVHKTLLSPFKTKAVRVRPIWDICS